MNKNDFINSKMKHFVMIYFLNYTSMYFIYTYLTVYFDDLNFSATQIGMITSTGAICTIFFQGFWGNLADKAKSKNLILIILLIGSGIASLSLQLNKPSFWLMFSMMAILNFFYLNIPTISDAISLDYLPNTSWDYGRLRSWGSIGYAFFALVMTFFSIYFTKKNFFLIYSITLFLTIIPVCLAPKVRGGQTLEGAKKTSILALFNRKYKILLLVLLFNMFVQTSVGVTMSYFSIYLVNHLKASTNLLSLAFFMSSAFEIPIMIYANKFAKKIDFKWLLLIVAVSYSLRSVICAVVTVPIILVLTSILMSIGNGISFYANIVFINNNVPIELKASGQGLWGIAMYGVSRVISSLLGGRLIDLFGMTTIFLAAGLFAFAAIAVFYLFIFRKLEFGKAV